VIRPLLPAIDGAGRDRELAIALILRTRRPIAGAEIAAVTGLSTGSIERAIRTLGTAGWIDVAHDGRVAGAAGLSLTHGPHRLRLRSGAYRTWCAYDALGIATALAADAEVLTECGVCTSELRVSYTSGRLHQQSNVRLWLANGGTDLRASFCSPTVLLCSADHGRVWAERHGKQGSLLGLGEASRRGGEDWAGCAAAARTLA
jgi:hypothetical protein